MNHLLHNAQLTDKPFACNSKKSNAAKNIQHNIVIGISEIQINSWVVVVFEDECYLCKSNYHILI